MADNEETPAARRRAAKAPAAKAKAKVKPTPKPKATPQPKATPRPKATPKPKAPPQPLPKPPGPVIGRPPIGSAVFQPGRITAAAAAAAAAGPLIAQPIRISDTIGISGPIRIPDFVGGATVDVPPAASVTPPPQVRPVFVTDNTAFITRIRPNIWELPIFRPSKTVVVNQSPPPGDVVPAGTPITVTTTVKQLLPLTGLQVSPVLTQRFNTAGDIEDLVVQASTVVQTAVANQEDYARLGQAERQEVDNFLTASVPDAANLDENGRAALFADISFVARF